MWCAAVGEQRISTAVYGLDSQNTSGSTINKSVKNGLAADCPPTVENSKEENPTVEGASANKLTITETSAFPAGDGLMQMLATLKADNGRLADGLLTQSQELQSLRYFFLHALVCNVMPDRTLLFLYGLLSQEGSCGACHVQGINSLCTRSTLRAAIHRRGAWHFQAHHSKRNCQSTGDHSKIIRPRGIFLSSNWAAPLL